MGLIRKTLSVGTAGVVSGSSKKQRVAKRTQAAIEKQAAQDVALAVGSARFQAELVGTPQARRAALEFELAQMPRGMHRNMRQRGRAKQIEAELATLSS